MRSFRKTRKLGVLFRTSEESGTPPWEMDWTGERVGVRMELLKPKSGSDGEPARGEIWLADLDPTRGHEQAGRRPVLILSEDPFNKSRAGLVIAVPITSTLRRNPFRVRIPPMEGGLKVESDALCEAVRSISKDRLVVRFGKVKAGTLAIVEDRLRVLLGL
jgi:mRNA interferase MazF